MRPETFANVVSAMLYEKRFGPYYAEPVVAGLDPVTFEPFITGMDLIGAAAPTDNFVVCGNNEESLFGVCESMYKVRSISRWSPYDRVGEVNADP